MLWQELGEFFAEFSVLGLFYDFEKFVVKIGTQYNLVKIKSVGRRMGSCITQCNF
jgi:hypothetical protein